ncbi:MAG: hypothetical protein LBR53_08575 [Deltaproteobacteria bacterium]|nr:hypothetical protein [Deltaproteobacteria bacterium]
MPELTEFDLSMEPELVATFAVARPKSEEGSVGGVYRTVGALSAMKNKVATKGDPRVFPLKEGKILLADNDDKEAPFKIVNAENRAKWESAPNPISGFSELRGLASVGDDAFGLDGGKGGLVKFDVSSFPWKVAKSFPYLSSVKGAEASGELLGLVGKRLAVVINEVENPQTPKAVYHPARLVFADPETLSPLKGTLNGNAAESLPLGLNATAMDVYQDPATGAFDILVACAGGPVARGENPDPETNGEKSTLELATVSFAADGAWSASAKTVLKGLPENGGNIQSVAVNPVNGAAFLLLTGLKGISWETNKAKVAWELYSTGIGVLKLHEQAPVSILGVPVQKNGAEFDEGRLWDLVHNKKNDELWMAHGDSIYIYRLKDRDPWGDPDVFSQEDLNPAEGGNLLSFAVTVESQVGTSVKELRSFPKFPVARRAIYSDSLRFLAL